MPRSRRTVLLLLAGCWLAAPASADESERTAERERMVQEVVIGGGIKDARVIAAMRKTPRHQFVPESHRADAYREMALPIGEEQTISSPYIVSFMTEELAPKPTDKVLEIGTGSGYQAAVLNGLVKEVYTIEIVESLGKRAAETLRNLGYRNVNVRIGDGYQCWPENAPFDKIIVTCSPEKIPQPLVDQLKEGGRMLIPLGERYTQSLCLFRKSQGKLIRENLEPTFFVPMTGEAEARREDLPRKGQVEFVNGNFERENVQGDWPVGWYYLRKARLVSQQDPQPNRMLRFRNFKNGQVSQAMQAFGVDGRSTRTLQVRCRARGQLIVPGMGADERAQLLVLFFNQNREFVGRAGVAEWRGSFPWREFQSDLQVPEETRGALMVVGLLGAIGQLDLDDVTVSASLP